MSFGGDTTDEIRHLDVDVSGATRARGIAAGVSPQQLSRMREPAEMSLGVKNRRVRRERPEEAIAVFPPGIVQLPLRHQLSQIFTVHLLLTRQLRDSRLDVLPLQHEKADEHLVADRLRPPRRSP